MFREAFGGVAGAVSRAAHDGGRAGSDGHGESSNRNCCTEGSQYGDARPRQSGGALRVRVLFPGSSATSIRKSSRMEMARASISIPLADSITTWRMAMLASTTRGALGSGTSSIKVFQDFFADLDLPVTLTQGDRVSIPVAVYNYSGARGDVSLKLQNDDWFSLVKDVPEKTLQWMRAAWAGRNSPSKPSASANSS